MVYKWSIEWHLQFSIDKCQYLQIGYIGTSIHYNIGTAVLMAVLSNKDFGFIINSTLKPSSHSTNIIKNSEC